MSDIVRTETWERNDGQRVVVDVRSDETVVVAVPILHQIMDDLGYQQVTA